MILGGGCEGAKCRRFTKFFKFVGFRIIFMSAAQGEDKSPSCKEQTENAKGYVGNVVRVVSVGIVSDDGWQIWQQRRQWQK